VEYQNYFLENIMNMTKPMKTIFSTAAVCIVIAFVSVASVNASDNDIALDAPIEHQGNKHKMKRMAKALSLSEQQQVQIKAIKQQVKEQHKALRESMTQFKEEEKKLLQTKSFNEDAYSALYEAYQPIFAQIALIRVKNRHAVFNVLTEEQQEKWLKMTKHHKRNTKKARG